MKQKKQFVYDMCLGTTYYFCKTIQKHMVKNNTKLE